MKSKSLTTLALILLSSVCVRSFSQPQKDDRQQIIDRLHRIFQAFVKQDTVALRSLHAKDWVGFPSAGQKISKGIDSYMKGAKGAISAFPMRDYEIQEIEIQVYGNLAVVYYVAQVKSRLPATGQTFATRMRAVDIYRKEAQGWNQIGSNLNILPRPGAFSNPDCVKFFDITALDAGQSVAK